MKKIISIVIILIIFIGLLVACTPSYEFNEDDFSLTITVSETEVRIGDTVEVTATFKNLSGRDIRIRMPARDMRRLEDLVLIGIFREREGVDYRFDFLLGTRPRCRRTLRKDEIITNTIEFHIEEQINYVVLAAVFFSVGENFSERRSIETEPTIISVT